MIQGAIVYEKRLVASQDAQNLNMHNVSELTRDHRIS